MQPSSSATVSISSSLSVVLLGTWEAFAAAKGYPKMSAEYASALTALIVSLAHALATQFGRQPAPAPVPAKETPQQ